jgi:hypothetical protein
MILSRNKMLDIDEMFLKDKNMVKFSNGIQPSSFRGVGSPAQAGGPLGNLMG